MAITTDVVKTVIARFKKGEDLYLSLARLVREHGVRSGSLQAIGAVRKARLGVYVDKGYEWVEHEGPMEIASCTGNVALKEGEPFVHCHAVLADHKGAVIAGHVAEGCIVEPTAEVFLQIAAGEVSRKEDEETSLWFLDV